MLWYSAASLNIWQNPIHVNFVCEILFLINQSELYVSNVIIKNLKCTVNILPVAFSLADLKFILTWPLLGFCQMLVGECRVLHQLILIRYGQNTKTFVTRVELRRCGSQCSIKLAVWSWVYFNNREKIFQARDPLSEGSKW